MNQNLIYYPCLALMLLTALVIGKMFFLRVKAVKSGQIDARYFKTYDYPAQVPNHVTQASRNFTNLFEVPTLFYVLCLFYLYTGNVNLAVLVLAWSYTCLRYIHSYIHLTSNKIVLRMSVYGLSWLIILTMCFHLAFKLSV